MMNFHREEVKTINIMKLIDHCLTTLIHKNCTADLIDAVPVNDVF